MLHILRAQLNISPSLKKPNTVKELSGLKCQTRMVLEPIQHLAQEASETVFQRLCDQKAEIVLSSLAVHHNAIDTTHSLN
jgi:hypothetical protein